jgi:hypothetical protein
MTARWIQPAAVFDDWHAPFFYEDRGSLFYVVLTPVSLSLSAFTGFGTASATSVMPLPKSRGVSQARRPALGRPLSSAMQKVLGAPDHLKASREA